MAIYTVNIGGVGEVDYEINDTGLTDDQINQTINRLISEEQLNPDLQLEPGKLQEYTPLMEVLNRNPRYANIPIEEDKINQWQEDMRKFDASLLHSGYTFGKLTSASEQEKQDFALMFDAWERSRPEAFGDAVGDYLEGVVPDVLAIGALEVATFGGATGPLVAARASTEAAKQGLKEFTKHQLKKLVTGKYGQFAAVGALEEGGQSLLSEAAKVESGYKENIDYEEVIMNTLFGGGAGVGLAGVTDLVPATLRVARHPLKSTKKAAQIGVDLTPALGPLVEKFGPAVLRYGKAYGKDWVGRNIRHLPIPGARRVSQRLATNSNFVRSRAGWDITETAAEEIMKLPPVQAVKKLAEHMLRGFKNYAQGTYDKLNTIEELDEAAQSVGLYDKANHLYRSLQGGVPLKQALDNLDYSNVSQLYNPREWARDLGEAARHGPKEVEDTLKFVLEGLNELTKSRTFKPDHINQVKQHLVADTSLELLNSPDILRRLLDTKEGEKTLRLLGGESYSNLLRDLVTASDRFNKHIDDAIAARANDFIYGEPEEVYAEVFAQYNYGAVDFNATQLSFNNALTDVAISLGQNIQSRTDLRRFTQALLKSKELRTAVDRYTKEGFGLNPQDLEGKHIVTQDRFERLLNKVYEEMDKEWVEY